MWFEDDTYEDFGFDFDDYEYFDDDDDYYYSDSDSDAMDLRGIFRSEDVKLPCIDAKDSTEDQIARPQTLVDICSRFVALNFPFAYIESRYPPVPDVLQRKIISFSFPENEALIEKYAKLGQKAVNFEYPRKLCSKGGVTNMRQIGFRLSATVKASLYQDEKGKSFYVVIYFDRGKITSAYCSCEAQRSWCSHVIAVIFQRIQLKDVANIQSKVPISDSLNALSKEKLLKFTQYLLCEHKNEPVIETAQILLDKLLFPEKNVEDGDERFEDINKIHGAPDPTAGSGWEDESRWFVCNEGFKSRCQDITYASFTDLGFSKIDDSQNIGYVCVHDLWLESYRGKQLQMTDNMEKELSFESFNYGHSKSYRNNRTLKLFEILETIEDLLQGDLANGISLLSSCTEEVITKLERTSSCRDLDSIAAVLPSIKSNLANTTPTTSLAMGFTPRPFSCWTFLDELSRLWRLVTLNPYLPPKHHQEILKTFASWRSRVTTGCFRAHLVPWLGIEVADALGQLEWYHSDIKAVCEGRQLCQPKVCSYTAVRVSEEIRQENKCFLGALSSFNLPSQICFGSEAIDILTCCSLVDALNLCKDNLSAVRLSLHLAVSLITHFKEEISIGKDSLDLPIVNDVILDSKENVQKEETSEKKLAMETDSSTGGWKKTKCEIWPQGTVLSVTTFAFLYNVMSKNRCILESCINEAMSQGKTVEQLSNIDSVDSLLFQLGVVGLMVPRFPSASFCGEVEQWQNENWLTNQLLSAKLTENDIELLLQISYFVYQQQWWFSAPPISLARVSFYHLFKDAVGGVNGELTPRNEIGVKLALHVLETSKLFQAISIGWAMFQYATYKHWSKLVGLVLDYLSGFPEYLDKAVEHVLHEDGFLGTRDGRHSDQISSANLTLETQNWLEESRNDMQARVAFSLAKDLNSKSRPSLEADVCKGIETFKDKLPKKCKDAESRFCICLIKMGARGALLGKNSNISSKSARQESLRWLISFAVKCSEDGIKCLMACDGGITHFMRKDEILDLCASLMGEKEESLHVYAREILMNEVDAEMLQSEASHWIQQIFTFCRERPSVRKNNVLPWICREIQERAHQGEVPFDVLFEASESLFDLFKGEKQRNEISILRRIELEKRRSDVFQPSLARLFNENSMEEEEENVSDPQLTNPYMAPEPHPFLQLAYDLGLLAVESLQRHSHCTCEVEVLPRKKYGRSRKGIKHFLCDFSRIVCYVVKKSWLKSEREDPAGENLPQTNEYLERFVMCLIKSVENPCWLFAVLEKMAEMLKVKYVDEDSISHRGENSVLTACSKYNVLQVLLEQCLGAFSKLLTGPEIDKKLKDLESLHYRNEKRLELELRSLYVYSDMRFEDVFRSAKRAFCVLDHSKNSFEELLHEIETRHSWVKPFLDDNIRNDSNQRNVRSFPLEALLHRYLVENLIEQML